MPYKSILSSNSNVLAGKTNPFADHFKPGQYYVKQQPKPKQSQPKQQQEQVQPKKESLLGKITRTGKTVANAAVESERAIAKPIARMLPGGQNDIKAEQAQVNQNIKTTKAAKQMIDSGNPKSILQGKKLLASNKQNIQSTSGLVNKTSKEIKETTDKKRIVSGALGTAADILTAGTYGNLAKGTKATSLLGRVKQSTNGLILGNAAAGGLNATAGGGDNRTIAENAAAGALLPEALHLGGKGISQVTGKAVNTIMDKIRAPKALLDNAKTQQALKVAEQDKTMKAIAEGDKIDQKIELINAKKGDDKFTNVDKVKVKQLEAQKQQLIGGPEQPLAKAGDQAATPQMQSASVPKQVKPPKSQPLVKENVSSTANIPETSVKDVPQGTSKVAQRLAKDLKAAHSELAGFDKVNWKDQAEKAIKLTSNRDELEKVISGEKPLPDGLRATALLTAITKHPELIKDHELLLRAAKSSLASESSRGAQEINLAKELAQHNPIEAIRRLGETKAKSIERKTGKSVDELQKTDVRAAQAAKPKVTRETWASFVESISC